MEQEIKHPVKPENLKAVIAANVADLRRRAGMTQQDLAEKLFVSRQTVCRW